MGNGSKRTDNGNGHGVVRRKVVSIIRLNSISMENELIKWMEKQIDDRFPIAEDKLYRRCIAKAKELQGKEKWAVVDKHNVFDTKEAAEVELGRAVVNKHPLYPNYTIVKIIE